MAKTKRKNKRNKRNKVYRKESCASRKTEQEIENNSNDVFNLLDMLSPAITPSTPIFTATQERKESSENILKITECTKINAGDSNNKTVESEISTTPKRISTYIQQKNESKKSIAYFKTPAKQTRSCSCLTETPKITISTPITIAQSTPNFIDKTAKIESNNNDIDTVIEQIPVFARRNTKSAQNFIQQPPFVKQTKSTPVFKQPSGTKIRDISEQHIALAESPLIAKFTTPFKKALSVHNSTPMFNKNSNYANNILSSKLKNELKNESNYNCVQEDLSPILIQRTLSIEPFLAPQKLILESCETPVRKIFTPKPRKNYLKYSLPIHRIYSWLQILLKKSYATLTRFLYGIRNHKSFTQESVKCLTCKEEIRVLTNKITVLENELQTVKEELKSIEGLRGEIKEINKLREQLFSKTKSTGCMPSIQTTSSPPAPPPPPPPPPPMPIFVPPPVSRPLKNSKKAENSNENSRPLITVEDLLKVRLKKITSSSVPINKKPPTLDPDELLKQVKLRPMSRQTTPQILSNSPTDRKSVV